jgi:hypothetical protein
MLASWRAAARAERRDVKRRAFRRACGAVCLLGGLWAEPALAQVNVEPLRQQLAADGWGGRIQASVAAYAGNTSGVVLGSAGFIGLRGSDHLGYAVLTGDYTKLDGVVSVAKWFAHARHNYSLKSWLFWEEYAQLESERFRRVSLRALVGTGPRFKLFENAMLDLFCGVSYMYEHTRLSTGEDSMRGQGGAHRISNYVALTLRAQERIVLSSVTYAQPRADDPGDVRALSVSSADFTVTKRLHSRLDAVLRYSSVVPPDIARADFELKNSLELLF